MQSQKQSMFNLFFVKNIVDQFIHNCCKTKQKKKLKRKTKQLAQHRIRIKLKKKCKNLNKIENHTITGYTARFQYKIFKKTLQFFYFQKIVFFFSNFKRKFQAQTKKQQSKIKERSNDNHNKKLKIKEIFKIIYLVLIFLVLIRLTTKSSYNKEKKICEEKDK